MTERKKPPLRLDAYYFAFEPTGAPTVDRVLSAVAWAGKAYHHTRDWNDDTEPFGDNRGQTPRAWIQNAAEDAAKAHAEALDAIKKLLELVDEIRDNTEERYPSADHGCIECTRGVTPDRFNTGPCAYHAAKALLEKSAATDVQS